MTIVPFGKDKILPFINLDDLILNGVADLKKNFLDKDKDLSGYYKLGEVWGNYVTTAPSQDVLKNRCESKKNLLGIKVKVPTLISSKEVQKLFGSNKEAN